jgi:hypothetical protein
VGELRVVFEVYNGWWPDPPEILLRVGSSSLQEAKEAGPSIGIIDLIQKARSVFLELSKRSDKSGNLSTNRQEVE